MSKFIESMEEMKKQFVGNNEVIAQIDAQIAEALNSKKRIKKQVYQLNAGDDLGNCVILSQPIHYGDYCGQKNRMSLKVRYANGEEKVVLWGRNTTVTLA